MGAVAAELQSIGHRPNFFYLQHAMGLASSMGLGIAIVSYNGEAYFGLTADPGIVPDVEQFTAMLQEAAEECAALAAGSV